MPLASVAAADAKGAHGGIAAGQNGGIPSGKPP